MPQQAGVSPEETRLKKFYTEQYNIEAGSFAGQARNQDEFDRGIGKLQAKYKLAFNEAKMRMDRPDPAFKQYSELDIYRNRLEQNVKQFRVLPAGKIPSWWRPRMIEKTAPEELQILDPTKVSYDTKGRPKRGAWRKAKLEEVERYGVLSNELERVTAAQHSLLRPGKTAGLLQTAATSPRMGGALRDQAKVYLEQRETVTERQEPEKIISRGGKQWRIVGHDDDGTPLVEEVR
jgi:hypothetical protein